MRVSSMVRANAVTKEAKATKDFELVFGPIDLMTGGVVTVCDAALGNVRQDGTTLGEAEEKVFSQAAYLSFYGEDKLLKGESGQMQLWDWRSHRLN